MDHGSTPISDDLGFHGDYVIEVDPEFPGDGVWTETTAGYDPDGARTDFLDSRRGTKVVVRVAPKDAAPWVASFSGEHGSAFSGVFGTPSPDRILVVVRGCTFLVPALAPQPKIAVLAQTTTQVIRAGGADRCLLAGFYSAAVLDSGGLRWKSPRLCWDDLRIDDVRGSKVFCSGEFFPRGEFMLDLDSGQWVSGSEFTDPSGFTASSEFTDASR